MSDDDPIEVCERRMLAYELIAQAGLNSTNINVLVKYFALGMTLTEIANHFRVTPERIRQRLAWSLRKIRCSQAGRDSYP